MIFVTVLTAMAVMKWKERAFGAIVIFTSVPQKKDLSIAGSSVLPCPKLFEAITKVIRKTDFKISLHGEIRNRMR